MAPAEQVKLISDVEALLSTARIEAEAGRDATIHLWLVRRALKAFGRRSAKKKAPT